MDLPIPTTVKAKIVSLTDNTSVDVHFNPTSLVYTVENLDKQSSGRPDKKQHAARFSGKLTMDLQFDTTGTGVDVRKTTNQIAKFMQSSADASRSKKGANAEAPPVLRFEWGSYQFMGTMETFKETIDFFSADGVPLRSLLSIGLARQDKFFDNDGTLASSKIASQGSLVQTGQDYSVDDVAAAGGDASAARQLGTDNGLESLRFTGGAALEVNAGVQFNAAVGFAASASAGAGMSIGGGAGISVGGSAGIGAGFSAGVSVGASAGVSFGASAGVASAASLQISAGAGGGALFGAKASAGVAATAGAFAGLESGRAKVSSTARLNPLRMLPTATTAGISTGANATFNLGGASTSSSGFSSNVGAQFSFGDRLVFDTDSDN